MTESEGGKEQPGLPWWPEPRETAPPREPLTRDRVVAKAIEIADRDGLDALSMRRLGQELGTTTTGVYWRVKNKDELLDLAADQIVGEADWQDDPALPWQERLVRYARTTRRIFRRHPGIAQLIGARVTLGPNLLHSVDALIGILRSAGFDGDRLALAYQVVLTFASGFGVMESRRISGPTVEGLSSDELQAKMAERLASIPVEAFPNLVPTVVLAFEAPEDAAFEYGLQLLVEGMAADLERAHGIATG